MKTEMEFFLNVGDITMIKMEHLEETNLLLKVCHQLLLLISILQKTEKQNCLDPG